jgi:hypothetical protein
MRICSGAQHGRVPIDQHDGAHTMDRLCGLLPVRLEYGLQDPLFDPLLDSLLDLLLDAFSTPALPLLDPLSDPYSTPTRPLLDPYSTPARPLLDPAVRPLLDPLVLANMCSSNTTTLRLPRVLLLLVLFYCFDYYCYYSLTLL